MYHRMYILLLLLPVVYSYSKQIDPSDPKTNLDYFVRSTGCKDANVSSVTYFNGSVYAKQPDTELQRLFYFEGFNINRKLLQANGSYLTLSRELVVYRHPNTSQILQVWINPWTGDANEVFKVANDPVNGMLDLGSIIPYQTILRRQIVFDSDYILEYPNPLTPSEYSKYSAGDVYDAAELYSLFANLSDLATSAPSVPSIGTWIRKSQYLPWMEMSDSPGSLYYSTLTWKCKDFEACLADDILTLVNDQFPKYKNAPTEDSEPNESSWTVFKKIIDQRRADGQPDIIIPQVPAVSNITTKAPYIDGRVLAALNRTLSTHFQFNGSAVTEITGRQSLNLINFAGYVSVDFELLPRRDGYRFQLDGEIRYFDDTWKPVTFWKNPITDESMFINASAPIGVDFVVKNDFIYTIDMKPDEILGLILAFSTDEQTSSGKTWTTNFANIIFENPGQSTAFYGSAGQFSSWPAWMKMGDVQGNMVAKATLNGQ